MLGALLGALLLRNVRAGEAVPGERFSRVERVFVVLQILTACSVAFAHGSNDVANAIGPLAAIVSVVEGSEVVPKAPVQPWMLAVGGLGIVFGLATWGYRVMETVGRKITELTPSRGFAAELATATTIVLASRLGIPSPPPTPWSAPCSASASRAASASSICASSATSFSPGWRRCRSRRPVHLLLLLLQGSPQLGDRPAGDRHGMDREAGGPVADPADAGAHATTCAAISRGG